MAQIVSDVLEVFRVRLDVERPLSYDNSDKDGAEFVAHVQKNALGHIFQQERSAWHFAFDTNISSLMELAQIYGGPVPKDWWAKTLDQIGLELPASRIGQLDDKVNALPYDLLLDIPLEELKKVVRKQAEILRKENDEWIVDQYPQAFYACNGVETLRVKGALANQGTKAPVGQPQVWDVVAFVCPAIRYGGDSMVHSSTVGRVVEATVATEKDALLEAVVQNFPSLFNQEKSRWGHQDSDWAPYPDDAAMNEIRKLFHDSKDSPTKDELILSKARGIVETSSWLVPQLRKILSSQLKQLNVDEQKTGAEFVAEGYAFAAKEPIGEEPNFSRMFHVSKPTIYSIYERGACGMNANCRGQAIRWFWTDRALFDKYDV